jgi:hypothetical protein
VPTLVEGEKISILELMDRQWQLAGIRECPDLTFVASWIWSNVEKGSIFSGSLQGYMGHC